LTILTKCAVKSPITAHKMVTAFADDGEKEQKRKVPEEITVSVYR